MVVSVPALTDKEHSNFSFIAQLNIIHETRAQGINILRKNINIKLSVGEP